MTYSIPILGTEVVGKCNGPWEVMKIDGGGGICADSE